MLGILLLDKPLGLSSNHALQRVRKRLVGARAKRGTSAASNPLATGMLPSLPGRGHEGDRGRYRPRSAKTLPVHREAG